MKYTKISIFSMLCAGTLLSLADIAIGNKNISKVSAATEIANAKNIESTKSNMVISLNGTGRTVDSDKQVAVYDQPNGNVVRYLKPGTNWKIFKKYYDVDNNWYNLGGNQWVREKDLTIKLASYVIFGMKGIANVINGDTKVAVCDKPNGNVIRYLAPGTNWKVFKCCDSVKKYGDVHAPKWYNLGGNQWVNENYVGITTNIRGVGSVYSPKANPTSVLDKPFGKVIKDIDPNVRSWKIFKIYRCPSSMPGVQLRWYNLGGNQWVDGSYMVANITSMEEGIYDLCDYREYEDCPIIKVRCNSNAGIRVWAAPGIKPTGKCLPNGSSWKVLKIYYHNSDVWYNLGGNQWVSKKGTVYLENKFYK